MILSGLAAILLGFWPWAGQHWFLAFLLMSSAWHVAPSILAQVAIIVRGRPEAIPGPPGRDGADGRDGRDGIDGIDGLDADATEENRQRARALQRARGRAAEAVSRPVSYDPEAFREAMREASANSRGRNLPTPPAAPSGGVGSLLRRVRRQMT